MGWGYVLLHRYQEPAPRPKKKRSIGGIILLVFGAVIVMASIAGCLAIDLIPGDHGDQRGRNRLGRRCALLYVVPFRPDVDGLWPHPRVCGPEPLAVTPSGGHSDATVNE